MTDSGTFKSMFKNWRVGQTLTVEVLRDSMGVDNGKKLTCLLVVGEKKKEVIHNPPPLRTVSDIETILKDYDKLEKCAGVIWNVCDDDLSGLVTRAEFATTMSKWLSDNLGKPVTKMEMEDVFDAIDKDKSGFLRKSEFTPVVKKSLEAFLKKHKSAAASSTPPPPLKSNDSTPHPGHTTPASTPAYNPPPVPAPSKKKKTLGQKICCCLPCCKAK